MKSPSPKPRRSDPAPLLRAARALFVRYGVRRTSMDDVAREAGVAKGTLYLAFDSKDALFRGVCADLCDEILARGDAAAAAAEPGLPRVRARLVAKYVWLHGWLNESPHADELLASKDQVAADLVQSMDLRFVERLAGDVAAAAEADGISLAPWTAEGAARALMRIARSASLADEGAPLPTQAVVEERLGALLALAVRGLGFKN